MIERYERFIIAAVIVLAVLVQLAEVPTYSPDYDQANVLYLAWDFVAKGVFPVHGVRNSLLAYNPPFFVWLYLLPMILTTNPGWILILPALSLHVIALLVLYILGRRYFGSRVGLVAVGLYAFSDMGLYFGHSSWAQGILSPLYVLMVFCVFQWLLEDKPWYLTLLIPLAAFITGIHWGGIIAFGVLLILTMIFHARLLKKPIVVGGLIALMLWTPYLNFEWDRGFTDIRALVQGPMPAPKPEDVTSFCQATDQGQVTESLQVEQREEESFMSLLKGTIRSKWPEAYTMLAKVKQKSIGMIRALNMNFHWDPFGRSPGSLQQRVLYFAETVLFLLGLGILLHRLGFQRTATPAERLLLLTFILPALMQNMSPHTTVSRPDVSWLFYGPQIIIIAYACSAQRWARTRTVQSVFLAGLSMLIIVESLNAWKPISQALKSEVKPGRVMVADCIADDLISQGRQHASIRYDFLQDRPQWCWVASYGALEERYSVGTAYDYLLLSQHGIVNVGRAPDGWASNPDYIVVFPEGLHRYDLVQGAYQVIKDLGELVVLKVLK